MCFSFAKGHCRRQRLQSNEFSFSSSYTHRANDTQDARERHHSQRDASEAQSECDAAEGGFDDGGFRDLEEQETSEDYEEDGKDTAPLLPIFNAAHLDKLPIYALTHTIRLTVSASCDTVLTWDQLRSPQVSRYLLGPIQQEIKQNYFSAASIYCLMTNCLQFTREIKTFPRNSGTIQTRAMVCELLAIRMLREYTPRELIDTLSYDFDPLQGKQELIKSTSKIRPQACQSTSKRHQPRSARISCLEIAVRAQAKTFLAYPTVVQQLNAIWDGSIIFHAAADTPNRIYLPPRPSTYGTTSLSSSRHTDPTVKEEAMVFRKVVTLYNPRDASLFKLSRLRVPRYRAMLSTFSFAILLGLFVTVLVHRSGSITPIEVVFWFWTAGYMVDELLGVGEHMVGLYIASFWKLIEFGIILILTAYMCLRISGLFIPDDREMTTTNMAFDLLAADAILLFPRIFSVLDHYKYFSQLIVAFRYMALDTVAIVVLCIAAYSGFFVALTLSFASSGGDKATDVAYTLLQIIMGYTAAVWESWATYTYLGRFILILFLGLTQFLVLTILITVLTNSFMAVVKNAHEEHQFIFAVNTMSSVKSSSMFAYVPPLNVIQWLLVPFKYVLPFKQYVRLNRAAMKFTHFPILFLIYIYEKAILQPAVVDRIDIVDSRKRQRATMAHRLSLLRPDSSNPNLRQDQALSEVFEQLSHAAQGSSTSYERKKSKTVVNKWMHDMANEGIYSKGADSNTIDKPKKWLASGRPGSIFKEIQPSLHRTLSAKSDVRDFGYANNSSPLVHGSIMPGATTPLRLDQDVQDAVAGKESRLPTASSRSNRTASNTPGIGRGDPASAIDYFTMPPNGGSHEKLATSPPLDIQNNVVSPAKIPRPRPAPHSRRFSSTTMIYRPHKQSRTAKGIKGSSSIEPLPPAATNSETTPKSKKKNFNHMYTLLTSPLSLENQDSTFHIPQDHYDLAHLKQRSQHRRPGLATDIVSDIGDDKAIGGGYVGAIPASFASKINHMIDRSSEYNDKDETDRFGRLIMARMNALEEGFRDVVCEMREIMRMNDEYRARGLEIRREMVGDGEDLKGKERT